MKREIKKLVRHKLGKGFLEKIETLSEEKQIKEVCIGLAANEDFESLFKLCMFGVDIEDIHVCFGKYLLSTYENTESQYNKLIYGEINSIDNVQQYFKLERLIARTEVTNNSEFSKVNERNRRLIKEFDSCNIRFISKIEKELAIIRR